MSTMKIVTADKCYQLYQKCLHARTQEKVDCRINKQQYLVIYQMNILFIGGDD